MALTELIAKSLLTAHGFLAGLSGSPIWALDEAKGEHTEIASAVTNVLRHYDIPGIDQKTVDFIMLAQVLGMAYGGRIFAARAMRAAPAPRAQPAPQAPPGPRPVQTPPTPEPAKRGPERMVEISAGHGLGTVLVPESQVSRQ